MESCECCRHTERSEEERRALINRLKRVEGQVRGLSRMVEEDAYCIDILTQLSAISSALSSFGTDLLGKHIRGCVVRDIKEEKDGTVDELIMAVRRLTK